MPADWLRQAADTPAFPDLLWSRPENRAFAGKLAIVGGNAQGFAAPAEAFSQAMRAGVGIARVLLPDALQKTLGAAIETGEYAPSTPSGSLSRQAFAELLELADWADGLLLAGDLGRNSETAILLESFLEKYHGQLTITRDSINYVISSPQLITQRPDTLLVLSFSQLQKLATALRLPVAVTSDLDMLQTISVLQQLTTDHPLQIITRHIDQFVVAAAGQVSTTSCKADERIWRLPVASRAAVWWLQHPAKPFEALTTSLVAD